MAMSASDPGAIRPFWGYRLKILAASVLLRPTKSEGLMRPVLTRGVPHHMQPLLNAMNAIWDDPATWHITSNATLEMCVIAL